MLMRDVGRILSMCFAVGVASLTAVSCGTSNSSVFRDGGVDSSVFGGDGSFGGGDSGIGAACIPKSCTDWGFTCGKNGDGCGAVIDCGTCTSPDFCGGGGRSKCGTTPTSLQDGGPQADAGTSCTPKTCEILNANCGWVSDSCGGVVFCGTTADGGPITLAESADAAVDAGANACPPPTICGGPGGSTPNQCSGDTTVLTDGGVNNPQCVPQGCPAAANCGEAGDGCGNILHCGGRARIRSFAAAAGRTSAADSTA